MKATLLSRLGSAGLLVVLLAFGIPGVASAELSCSSDTVCTSIFDQGNTALTGLGPFGQLTITVIDATHATLTYESFTGFLFGDGGSADANVSGNFSATVTGNSPCHSGTCQANGPYSFGNTNNPVDGLGTYDLQVDTTDGFGDASSLITVSLIGTFTTANEVLFSNADGFDAAVHVFVCDNGDCSSGSGAAVTGFASEIGGGGGGGGNQVPEPFSILLLGTVVASTGARLRKQFKGA